LTEGLKHLFRIRPNYEVENEEERGEGEGEGRNRKKSTVEKERIAMGVNFKVVIVTLSRNY
jgi:hypothetical protein